MKNTKTIFTLALMIAASFSLKAITYTGDITGQVVEQETKQPVAFAEVVLVNGNDKITVTANEYGHYTAKHIPMGKYEMHVVFNNRNFVMNNVKVKDSYTSRVDVSVSSSENLPASVKVTDATSDKVAIDNNAKGKKAQIALPALETSQGEIVIKYGTIIQDGQIMIIRNKPISLYA